MRTIACTVSDPLGFHIQLAVLLAGEAGRWRSSVTLEHAGRTVNAKQLMELLTLGIRSGEAISIHVSGIDEATASEAIERLASTF